MDKTLKDYLDYEFKCTIGDNLTYKHILKIIITRDPAWMRWLYIKAMRNADFREDNTKNILEYLIYLFYKRKKNILAVRLGYEIGSKNIQKGLKLFHNGPIVINNNTKIGANCSLHGDNCIGNDGKSELAPIIGDNVEIGVGAKIIGNVKIADNVVIGAGAVVVTDVLEKGAVVVGVPGKIVRKREK